MASSLTKEHIRTNYPVLYESYVLQASLPEQKYIEKETFWKNNEITCFQRWAVPYFVEREKEKKKPCLRLNYPSDGKCNDCMERRCRYDRVCFMCGQDGHGAFQVFNSGKLNGKYRCTKHRTFEVELEEILDKYDITEEDIRLLFITPEVTKPATNEKKEELKDDKKPSISTSSSPPLSASTSPTIAASTNKSPSGSLAASITSPSKATLASIAASPAAALSRTTGAASPLSQADKLKQALSASSAQPSYKPSSTSSTSNTAASTATTAPSTSTSSSINSSSNLNNSGNNINSIGSIAGNVESSPLLQPSTPPSSTNSINASSSLQASPPSLSLQTNFGVNFNINSSNLNSLNSLNNIGGISSNSNIGINGGINSGIAPIGSIGSTIDDFKGLSTASSSNISMTMWNDTGIGVSGGGRAGFGSNYTSLGLPLSQFSQSSFNNSLFDNSGTSSIYSQLGLGQSSNLGFMSQSSIGSISGLEGNGLSSGPLFSSLSLGTDALSSHSNSTVGGGNSLQLALHHASTTSYVDYQVQDSEEFIASSPYLRVSFVSSYLLKHVGNGLLYRGNFVSSRGQEDVSVLVIKKMLSIDKLLFKSEIGNIRQLGLKHGHNVARIVHKSALQISYPLSPAVSNNDEYFIVASEYSEIGYLDNYLSSLLSKRQSIPLLDLQSYALQLVEGLMRIHENNLSHMNIRPQSILVCSGEKYQPRLSSSNLCLKYSNFKLNSVPFNDQFVNECWSDPEYDERSGFGSNTHQYDVFALGCLLFYLASDGNCLFESKAQAIEACRDNNRRIQLIKRFNINNKSYLLFDLIENLTRPIAAKSNPNGLTRITLEQARYHPFLWNQTTRINILLNFAQESAKKGDEKLPRVLSQENFFKQLDNIGKQFIFMEKWTSQMDASLVSCVKPPNLVTDFKHSTQGLLQAIHNLYNYSLDEVHSNVFPQLTKLQMINAFITRITETDFPKLLLAISSLVSLFGFWTIENDELKHHWK